MWAWISIIFNVLLNIYHKSKLRQYKNVFIIIFSQYWLRQYIYISFRKYICLCKLASRRLAARNIAPARFTIRCVNPRAGAVIFAFLSGGKTWLESRCKKLRSFYVLCKCISVSRAACSAAREHSLTKFRRKKRNEISRRSLRYTAWKIISRKIVNCNQEFYYVVSRQRWWSAETRPLLFHVRSRAFRETIYCYVPFSSHFYVT